MDTTIIQVPVSKDLRNKATLAASRMGFSSVQEAIRIFLTQLPDKNARVVFEPRATQLSAKAAKRYERMSREIVSGKMKGVTFNAEDGIEKIMDYLNS